MEVSKESIKKKIKEFGSIKEILFYLDVVEKEVSDRISELYLKTRMNDIGDFLGGENGWEYYFEYREFNPEYMITPPLSKEEQKIYIKDFGKEIKEAEHLHNIETFIKDQKKFYEKQYVKYTLMGNGEKKIETENEGIQINFDCYNFDFNKIKKYAESLDPNKATLYLKYVLKEFDREKRENFYLFMSENEIKYFEENIVITDPAKIYEPADINMMGIGAQQSIAKENFEKNIRNEIEFINERIRLLGAEDDDRIEKYLDYGKECYLNTWKDDRIQLLSFEKKMIGKFGVEVEKYVVRIFKHIEKNLNPIELINCNIEKFQIDKNAVKTQTEILRIKEYINELEKLEMLTNHESGIQDIPEDELDKLNEWQAYYIKRIKDETLREWVEYLRRNRPGVYDEKYGENYKVDFEWVTENALKELKDYRDRLENLKMTSQIENVKDEITNKKNIYPDNETTQISNELANAHSIIKKQKNKISTLGKGITKTALIDTIEMNNCRFKNGKINYSKLANILGYSNHTAKERCDYYGIK